MDNELLPRRIDAGSVTVDDPEAVVEGFLAAMAAGDSAGAAEFVADDILYVNVGMRPIRGKRAVQKVLALLDRPGNGFEVYLHAQSSEGPVVLNERTDVLLFGPVRIQFWVFGRFEVHDGKITLWRDSFDYVDMARASVRGLLATVLPSLQTRPPRTRQTPPGR